jgi:sugar-specific transcriptional regulator TrmB
MDVKILEKLGLTRGEIKAYLALLKLGPSATGNISKESGVSRSKLYGILDKLERRGMASHVEKSGVSYFHAVEPRKIKDYIKEKEAELKLLSEEFDSFLPELEAFHKHKERESRVNVYRGMKGLKVAHEHKYLKLKRGEGYVMLGIPHYPAWKKLKYFDQDHEVREEKGITAKLLFARPVDKKVLDNRNSFSLCEARYMPMDINTPAYFEMYRDTTLIIIAAAEPISIEIVNQEVTDAYKAYFEEFWKRSTSMKRPAKV